MKPQIVVSETTGGKECERRQRRSTKVELDTAVVSEAGLVVTEALDRSRDLALDPIAEKMVKKGFLPMIGKDNDPDRFETLEDIGYWRGWIQGQANIQWRYRGAFWGQDIDRQMNDLMQAKRYFAYLLADRVITACVDGTTEGCPLSAISSSYAQYLQSITIHQFAQFRAYFARLKDHRMASSSPVAEKEDYLKAVDFLDNAFNATCPAERRGECVAWTAPPAKSQWEMIKVAKANIIRLLEPNLRLEADICTYVDRFYEWLSNSEAVREGKPSHENLLEYIYRDTHIVSVFEFLVKCFLARRLDVTKHNEIRTKLKKAAL